MPITSVSVIRPPNGSIRSSMASKTSYGLESASPHGRERSALFRGHVAGNPPGGQPIRDAEGGYHASMIKTLESSAQRSRRVIGKGGGSRNPRLAAWVPQRLRAFGQRRGLDVRRCTVVSAAPEPKAKNERRGGRNPSTATRRDAGSTAQPPCAQHHGRYELTRWWVAVARAPTTLRAVPAMAMPSSLRPTLSLGYAGSGAVASRVPVPWRGWRPTPLSDHPSRKLIGKFARFL